MSTAVKRACDACHRRKVKCQNAVDFSLLDKTRGPRDEGLTIPCRNCASAQLACTYNAIPQKKGPKGSRAKVISELRETQRQTFSAKLQNRTNAVSGPSVSSLAPTPGLLTNEMVKACVDFYFANMYATIPILMRQRLEQDILSMDATLDTYCLLCSLCAFMILQPGMSVPSSDPYSPDSMPGASVVTATLLLEEALRVRKGYDSMQNPSLYTLATSYFLFACHYGLDLHDKAWACIRDATTLVHLVRMNREDSYLSWDKVEATRRRRLYWLLYATERAYALQHDRPLSLKATVSSPSPADDPSDPQAGQLTIFCRLVSLFRAFDGTFVDLWNKTRTGCSSSLVATLQKQQNDLVGALVGTDPHLGDVTRNQQWLQNFTWQINVASSSSASNVTGSPYQNSLVGAPREKLLLASFFSSQNASELLASGLIESLLSITNELTDVLSMMPSSSNPFTVGPRDYLHQLANILAMLRIGEHRFAPLLLVKVHEVLPRLANPMLQTPPENAIEVDIFDGFGNAGVEQHPSYMAMDEYKTEAPDTTSSMQDTTPSFVSSPPILSPGMEFSHGMQELTPISDLVMPNALVSNNIAPLQGNEMTGSQHLMQLQSQQHLSAPSLSLQSQPSQHLQRHQPTQHPVDHRQLIPQQLPQQVSQQPAQRHHTFPQRHPTVQHHQSMPMMQGLSQSLCSNNTSTQHPLGKSIGHSPDIGAPEQPSNQAQSTPNVSASQIYTRNLEGLGTNLDVDGLSLRPQVQQVPNFGVSTQHIRPVGDYQALQGTRSDMSLLNPLTVNSTGVELDFGALR